MTENVFFRSIAARVATCLLGVFLTSAAQGRPDGPLIFEVLPKAQRIALGKPISLTFRVRNIGTQDALANRRFYLNHAVWLEISTPAGQKADWCGRMNDVAVSQNDFVILKPGAHLEKTVQVSCNEKRTSGFSLVAPGEYVVRARYELALPADALKGVAQGAVVMRGSLEAEPIRIEILGAQQ